MKLESRTKQNLLVTVAGILLFAALMNFAYVMQAVSELIRMVLPIIAGAILALFIHVPMSTIQKRLAAMAAKRGKPVSAHRISVLSFLLTVFCVLLVLVLVLTLLVPEIVESARNLYTQLEVRIAALEAKEFDLEWWETMLSGIDVDNIMQTLTESADGLFSNVVDAFSSTVSVVVTGAFALIISIYISLSKQQLSRHGTKLIRAYLPSVWAERILHFCRVFTATFSKFLSGQCTEAIILGTLMFLAFTLTGLPYGNLVGVLTAVCAIIPYVGAFISSATSAFLILLIEPTLVIRCLIVYSAVQFVENQFIYPRVVGESVGLPPLYTLIAAMIGGKLFGVIGIIFFIPLMAVAVELVKTDANQRLVSLSLT